MIFHNDRDNLGNHTASQALNMSNKAITGASGVGITGGFGIRPEATRLVIYTPSGDALHINMSGIGLPGNLLLDASADYVVVWSPSTKKLNYRAASSIGGGGGGGTSSSLQLSTTGAATHADPVTDKDLVFTSGVTQTTIDYTSTVYWNQGQAGTLVPDGTMANQPRFIAPEGYQVLLKQVLVTLGKAGQSGTTLQASILNDVSGSIPTPGSPTSTFTIPSGIVNARWEALEGTTLNSLQHLQTRIDTAGLNAQSLTIHFWGKTTLG